MRNTAVDGDERIPAAFSFFSFPALTSLLIIMMTIIDYHDNDNGKDHDKYLNDLDYDGDDGDGDFLLLLLWWWWWW
jgi:hypothetical protein